MANIPPGDLQTAFSRRLGLLSEGKEHFSWAGFLPTAADKTLAGEPMTRTNEVFAEWWHQWVSRSGLPTAGQVMPPGITTPLTPPLSQGRVGAELVDLTIANSGLFTATSGTGTMVGTVEPDSLGARTDLQAGDAIIRLDGVESDQREPTSESARKETVRHGLP